MKWLAGGLAALLVASGASASVIYTKKSMYRNIIVTSGDRQVCMQFVLRDRYRNETQSCMDKSDHQRLVFDYTRMVFAGLLVRPHPQRVLVIGLGGASIPRVFEALYPDAQLDVAEIDPAVVDVAKRFFDYTPGPHTRIITRDGRVFVKHALLDGTKPYDYIVLDAFNGDYIPEHLMTREFLEECKRLLAGDGVLVANTFSTSRLYDSESATYNAAFGWFVNIAQHRGNRIILTGNVPRPTESQLAQGLKQLSVPGLGRFGIHPRKDWFDRVDIAPDWNRQAKVLTDQYAPVNLLNGPH